MHLIAHLQKKRQTSNPAKTYSIAKDWDELSFSFTLNIINPVDREDARRFCGRGLLLHLAAPVYNLCRWVCLGNVTKMLNVALALSLRYLSWGRQVEETTLNGSIMTSRTLQEEKKFWVRRFTLCLFQKSLSTSAPA